MSLKRITDLAAAAALDGTELVLISQAGTTVHATAAEIAALLADAHVYDVSTVALASGVLNLDVSHGGVFQVSVDANITSVTLSALPATGKAAESILELTNTGTFTVTWPTTWLWPGGTPPALTANGVDHVRLRVDSAGTVSAYPHAGMAT